MTGLADWQMGTSTLVRVVGYRAQNWGDDYQGMDSERSMINGYIGKTGRIVAVDGRDMPYVVGFSEGAGVPLKEMRFHASEVEDVG